MSGGSHDHAYRNVDEFIERMETEGFNGDILREAFASHLKRVSAAMKAIEWVDSGDSSSPCDSEAIRRCLE